MKAPLKAVLLALFLVPSWLWSEAPWVAVSVSQEHETEAVARLEAAHVPVVSWSSAVVEVSAFEGLELVPLARLEERLTAQDPRWDPWLRAVPSWFKPRAGSVRLWVPEELRGQARDLVATLAVPVAADARFEISPPLVTGWTLVAFATLTLAIYVTAGVLGGWPPLARWRRWLWLPICLIALVGGLSLVKSRAGEASEVPQVSASWLQHRWFQEAWPWGAQWDNYAPDRAWSFRSYEKREGRLTEVDASLTAADKTWAQEAQEGLDVHHAQRIFGTPKP